MTARIKSVAQLDELPIGTIIAHSEANFGVDVAVKTRSGRWKSVWYTHPVRPAEIGDWIGADVMIRKVDYLTLAQHVDDCRKQVADAQNQRDAAEQRARLVAERIGELEDELDELRRELDAAKQVAA